MEYVLNLSEEALNALLYVIGNSVETGDADAFPVLMELLEKLKSIDK